MWFDPISNEYHQLLDLRPLIYCRSRCAELPLRAPEPCEPNEDPAGHIEADRYAYRFFFDLIFMVRIQRSRVEVDW